MTPNSRPSDKVALSVSTSCTCLAPEKLRHGDLAAFEPSSKAVEFEALTETEFVLGSAAPHKHNLVLGYYSVHTTPDALREGEAHISSIKERLIQEGRL